MMPYECLLEMLIGIAFEPGPEGRACGPLAVVCFSHIDDAGKETKTDNKKDNSNNNNNIKYNKQQKSNAVLINYCLDYDFNVF